VLEVEAIKRVREVWPDQPDRDGAFLPHARRGQQVIRVMAEEGLRAA
jgi:hypothetical protein